MILDGYGLNSNTTGNAIANAKTPVMDKLMAEYPFVKGNASGLAVGLPDGQMGNSEVGHLNMGAGRIVYQDLTRITKSIEDGSFFKNEALLSACANAREHDSALHMYGLVSDGGVHSHITHIYGLLELAKREKVSKVYLHCYLDGRDTPPSSGADYVKALYDKTKELGIGEIATIGGRYYAMDRDNRWDRVELAYKALTKGGESRRTSCTGCARFLRERQDGGVHAADRYHEERTPTATLRERLDYLFQFQTRPRERDTRVFCCDDFDKFDRGPRIRTNMSAYGL